MHESSPKVNASVEELCDLTAQLKHDLGKYVAFQSRWLDPASDIDELRAALIADLVETHRGPNGTRSSVEIWREQRATLEPVLVAVLGAQDAVWLEVVAGMARVERLVSELSSADLGRLIQARDVALSLSDAIARLHRGARALDV